MIIKEFFDLKALAKDVRNAVKNAGWLMSEKVYRLILHLVVTALVVRYLGPERYGQFMYILSFVLLFTPLVDLGTNGILVRDLTAGKHSKEVVLGSALLLKVIGSLIAIVTLNIVAWMIGKDEKVILFLIFIMSFDHLFRTVDMFDSYFQSQIKSKYTVFSRSISFSLTSIIRIVLILFGAGVSAFVFVQVLETILSACLLYFFIHV